MILATQPDKAVLALAVGGAIGGPLGVILALPAAALMRDIAFYTSYRAGGLSPAEAMSHLPSFASRRVIG